MHFVGHGFDSHILHHLYPGCGVTGAYNIWDVVEPCKSDILDHKLIKLAAICDSLGAKR